MSAIAKTVTPRALAHPAQGEAGKGSESARRGRWGGGHGTELAGVAKAQRPEVCQYTSSRALFLYSRALLTKPGLF